VNLLQQDADAAYTELLHLGYAPERIIVQGESLGTAIAVDLAMQKPCAGVILESPLMSAGSMARGVLPLLGLLLVRGYDTYGKISRVHAPLMVIHGDADEIVPFSQAKPYLMPLMNQNSSGACQARIITTCSKLPVPRMWRAYGIFITGSNQSNANRQPDFW
jgi:pimeloyl-ACP methyl ester carboxylesterase